MRLFLFPLLISLVIFFSCGSLDDASNAVILFSGLLADSSYSDAWEMLTPKSQLLYDSTVTVLHEFGWIEVQSAVCSLAGEMTEDEFTLLTGNALFTRMISAKPAIHTLSTNISTVTYPTDSLAVVVLNTADGLQEIIVQNVEGTWLINLNELVSAL